MKTIPKAVIIGLDAATWDLLGPWMEQGLMPNLARLRSSGVSGKLESARPPITPPAWTSLMTGKNPGKHGIFNFMEAPRNEYVPRYANATSRRTPTVWRLLCDAGFTVGTMNTPFTYPPEELNGFQISGMDTPSESSPFIYPAALREELEGVVGKMQLDLRYLGYMSTDERRAQVLAEMEQIDNQWKRIALHLIENHPQDVMMFTFMSIDTVQHYFWHYMDKNHFMHDAKGAGLFGDAVRAVYERLDAAVGELTAALQEETSVFVVSDHGGGPVSDRVIHLNRYLAQLGLLKYRADDSTALQRLNKKAVRSVYNLLQSSLSSRQKKLLAKMLPSLRRGIENACTSFASIDWSQTRAYCSEVLTMPPGICINLKGAKPEGIVEPSEYETLIELITAKLCDLKDPRTGEPVIKRVHRREEVFQGLCAAEGADLILDWWSEDSLFSTRPSFAEDLDKPALVIKEHQPPDRAEWSGTHRLHGIFLAKGPAFREGAECEGARLIDFSPNLLHLMGLPVPEDMDGRVLTGLYQPDYLAAHPVTSTAADPASEEEVLVPAGVYSDEETEQIEERLKALGYMD